MNLVNLVRAHIRRGTGVTTSWRLAPRKHVAIEIGELTLFIHNRKKLLEVINLLEQMEKEWE